MKKTYRGTGWARSFQTPALLRGMKGVGAVGEPRPLADTGSAPNRKNGHLLETENVPSTGETLLTNAWKGNFTD